MFGLSVYVMPVVIGIFSLLSLFFWQPRYVHTGALPLTFRVVEAAVDWTPAQALMALGQGPLVSRHDTQLSEKPLWFGFTLARQDARPPQAVEIPSRHAVSISCWDARSLELLGSADRQTARGRLTQVKAGFALTLGSAAANESFLCQARFVGPARLTLQQWASADLQISAAEFEHKSGLLDGGLLVLAIFVFITALINRSPTYVLFAVWLVVNLRMGALSAGWDSQWLDGLVPHEWLFQGRSLTMALYALLTVTLFRTLFQEELSYLRHAALLKPIQWLCFPLLLLSFLLPYRAFLPLLWVASALGMGVMAFLLGQMLRHSRSTVALWYSLSIIVTLLASLFEVISAALGFKNLIGSINSVTAALSSSLLASLAIAAQMRQEHEQKLQAQAELQHTYDTIPIGLFALNLQGQFLNANPALRNMLGADVLVPGSNSWQQRFSDEGWLLLLDLVQNQDEVELELEARAGAEGTEPRRFLVKATLAGERIEGSLQDVTEKSRAAARLQFLAHHDPLTDALNRRGMELALERATQQLNRGKPLALAYLDLDRFKLINDLYSHSVGDEVLRQICARVYEVLPRTAQLGRVGGDEFLVLLPDTSIEDAAAVCRSIVKTIGGTVYRIGERAFHVQGSMGLVEVTAGHSIKDAVSAADRACQEAKTGRDDNLMVYEKHSTAFLEHEEELRLVEQLATTAATTGLYLEMQPIMSLKTPSTSLNFEVLLRMRDAQGRQVPTARLIAAAEHSGRMGLIDRWVLHTTVEWIRKHAQELRHTRFVCVNLSGSSINDERFMQDVFSLLEENPEIASRLCLEITESVALHDIQRTRQFVDRIRSYGAKVALDDFGAGYTSFTYLMDLPSDLLKIDGSFIVNINHHPANVAIVEAIVNLAQNLGMRTIAEWAEDYATVQTLAEIGVDYVQGFVVARPQDPAQLLTATSAAAFIDDTALAQFIRMLDPSAPPSSEGSAFPGDRSNLH